MEGRGLSQYKYIINGDSYWNLDKKARNSSNKAILKASTFIYFSTFVHLQAEVSPFTEDTTIGPTEPSLKPGDYFGHGIYK
jgi:hypothetical protein